MSDHWEVYTTQINEQLAYVLYDHGLGEELNDMPLANCLHVLLEFKDPDEAGLPKRAEFDTLVELEDTIEKALQEQGAVYVGRISSNGQRRLLFYVNETEDSCQTRLAAIGDDHGYPLQYCYLNEPNKEGYWEFLYPTPDEWRRMLDMKVIRQLESANDQTEQARPIDHYTYFDAETDAHRFSSNAQEAGFTLGNINPPEEDREQWQVHLQFTSSALPEDIHQQTLKLSSLAEETNGYYDGWGCPIVAAEAEAKLPGGFDPLA